MTNIEKAKISIETAIRNLREKSHKSSLVERYFLLYEAWEKVKDLPQPLQMGKGLFYVLQNASLPVEKYDLLLGRYDDHVPTEEEQVRLEHLWSNDPNSNPIVINNGGHIILDFETIVKDGILGYISRVEKRIEEAERNCEGENALNFLQGMIWTYRGILMYIERYGRASEDAGLDECAKVCHNLTQHAPTTFREAMQLILFIYNVYLIYAGKYIACLTVGRLDHILLPLYQNDIKKGILTEDDAGAFIDDFSAKMSMHLGRGEHQMAHLNADYEQTGWLRNHVYDSPGYIVIGGYGEHIEHTRNPLTILFAQHIHPELKNPIYVFRYTSDCGDDLLRILSKKIQENASILLYNDETVIPAYLHVGVEKKDALNYGIYPCNWASLSGCSTYVRWPRGKSLPEILNDALISGKDFKTIDEIYEEVVERYSKQIRPDIEYCRNELQNKKVPTGGCLSINDCFMQGAIESAKGIAFGGVKYPAGYMLLRSIGTAADMLSAIDKLVFRDKVCTLTELVEATKNDFEGDEKLLQHCKLAPKYGTDDDFADGHATRLMTELLDCIDREATNETGTRDVYTFNVTINDQNHIGAGAKLSATVDGRRKGEPLSENLSPAVGYSKGVTALLNSVSKLPFERIHSGALNVRLRRNMVKGEDGNNCLMALIRTYFEQGGMQLQFSIADTEELKNAQKNPDEYRDLMVRITGYSAIFVDMSKGAQDEFIRREELE